MRRKGLFIAGVVALAALGSWCWPPTEATRAGWLADYETLRDQMPAAYANFTERLRTRKLSPRDLDARTREALRHARNLDEAQAALRAFVAAFDDNHLKVRTRPGTLERWKLRLTGKTPADPEALPTETPGAEACARMGYQAADLGEITWSALPRWRPLGGGTAERPFPAGLIEEEGHRPMAVLRIPSFGVEAFPALCAAQWEEQRRAQKAPCDVECQDAFTLKVESALIDRLAAQLEELDRAGAGSLLVDITGNGGGSSVADPMARALTAVPLRTPELGFIRHPLWEKRFTAARDAFAEELKRTDLPAEHRALLESARDTAEGMRAEAAQRCDLSAAWTQAALEAPCQPVGRFPGYLRYARPGELDGLKTKGLLFNPGQYAYREGVWTGPLYVLVDRWTASAAEGFAALLKDNGAATLLGERTLGSGCGYMAGGVILHLQNIGVTVRMPDCIRFRADGHSEAEGITPDIAVPWTSETGSTLRAEAAIAAARSAMLR
ncbi:S41 family peptidase [Sorangium sp. So ce1335]|uniref:S41 family peptidase n=1 Tax=Sorangium sp. So ce1335 TaxID=3133335 RepID=UPI003F5E9DA8